MLFVDRKKPGALDDLILDVFDNQRRKVWVGQRCQRAEKHMSGSNSGDGGQLRFERRQDAVGNVLRHAASSRQTSQPVPSPSTFVTV